MNLKKILSILLIYLLSLVFWTCKNETVAPITEVVLPELAYPITSLELLEGQGGLSPKPTLTGTAPFNFSLAISPTATGFSVDNEGIISIPKNLPENTYKITVTIKDSKGSKTFVNIFTVVVKSLSSTKLPPTNLKYTPNTLTAIENTTAMSNIPIVNSATSVAYSMNIEPATPDIVINPTTGMITVTSSAKAGKYSVSVTASNSFGSNLFKDIFLIDIKSIATKILYVTDIVPIFERYGCNGCHSTTYAGTKERINTVLDRIQRKEGETGFMPQGGKRLSEAEINIIKKWLADGLLEK